MRPASPPTATKSATCCTTYPVESLPHERVLANIEEASKHFNVLVLKTNMAVPYTSVFIRLDCKYWSADAENACVQRWGPAAHPRTVEPKGPE
jgi:hypothetical protein